MKIKVLYIVSFIDKAIAFEWIAEKLDKERFELSFILLNNQPSYLGQFFQKNQTPVLELTFRGKKDIPKTAWQVAKHIRKVKPDVVHTHLEEADFIGLMVARIMGVKKRIYTRHNSTYHKKYHSKAEILDKINNANCTHIVSISNNTSDIMMRYEGVPSKKIRLVYHGFDLDKFKNPIPEEVEELRKKYNHEEKRPVIGVIARYMHWKGIQFIIPAFKEILKAYPNAFLILANAKQGADYQTEIEAMLKTIPSKNYCEIIFENNLFALYHLFDVFVHVPIDEEIEAFGQIYVEALAAGIPSVFTKSGIAREFIEADKNALVVDFQNTQQIYDGIKTLLENEPLRKQLIIEGDKSVQTTFSLEQMIDKLERLYLE